MSFWQPSIALWWWVLAIGNVIRGVVIGEDSVSGATGTVSESALLKSDNLFNGAYHKKASSKNSIVVPVPMLTSSVPTWMWYTTMYIPPKVTFFSFLFSYCTIDRLIVTVQTPFRFSTTIIISRHKKYHCATSLSSISLNWG